jgi:hypothetical protein
MLITLQSNSDSDASDFVNFFKETVQIPEHAEIALLGCSYKFTKSFTVTSSNNTFLIRWGDSGLLQATVTEGEYTPDGFLTALNDALDNLGATIPYRISQAFPGTGQKWKWKTANKSRLVLTLTYAPVDWQSSLVKKDSLLTREQILLADPTQMTDEGSGIVRKITYSDTYDNGVTSGTAASDNVIWGTAEGNSTGETPHGVLRFQVPQLCQQMVCLRVGQKPTTFTTAGNWDIAIHFLKAGNFEIRERSGGVITNIKTDTYTADDFFEIRLDQVSGNDTESARYFTSQDPLSGFQEIEIGDTQPRLTYNKETKFICGASIRSPQITGGIHAPDASIGASTGYKEDAILSNNLVISDSGSDYTDGEIALAEGSTSSTQSFIRITCDAGGSITGYTVESTEGGYVAGEEIVITGSYSETTGATLTYSDPVTVAGDSNFGAIAGANTGYANGPADILIVSSATTITACVDLSTTAGAIDDFGFTSQAKVDEFGSSVAKTLADNARLEIVQGANNTAHVFVRNVRNVVPQIQGLGWSTVPSSVDEPLGPHDDAEFQCDEQFRSISGMPLSATVDATGGADIEGTLSIGTDRETQQMLINIEEFNIKSICKEGGVQKAVAMLPFGAVQPAIAGSGGQAQKIDGEYYYEPYNMVYHKFENPHLVNHNQLRVRFTDALGLPLNQLQHPVTVTLDLRPRAN